MLIFSVTTFDGKTESRPFVRCYGHSFLSIENRTGHSVYLKDYELEDNETLTFSVWAVSGHRGVFYNLEAEFIRQYGRYRGRQSLSTFMDESQLSMIEDYIETHDTWTFGRNCSRFSTELWNRIADESLRLKVSSPYTPEKLEKAFHRVGSIETDKDFSAAKGVFFYRDGVRTELTLCS